MFFFFFINFSLISNMKTAEMNSDLWMLWQPGSTHKIYPRVFPSLSIRKGNVSWVPFDLYGTRHICMTVNCQYKCINMYLVRFNWIYKKHSLNDFHEKCCQCFISLCAAQRYIYNDIFENFLIAFISST